MKTLQDTFEDFFGNVGSTPEDNKRRKTVPLIEAWLKDHIIRNYTINKDLTIDINGGVFLYEYEDKEIPEYIQFNKVNGDFEISDSKIISLRGCPKVVVGSFYCSRCHLLVNLENSPEKVGENFICDECNNLKSLKGSLEEVGGNFNCAYCKNLKIIEKGPKKVGKDFVCFHCHKLTSLEGAPEEIGSILDCRDCPNLKTLGKSIKKIGLDFYYPAGAKLKENPEEYFGEKVVKRYIIEF